MTDIQRKRVESLYRNLKQFPLLIGLCLLVPLLWLFLPLLTLTYWWLRRGIVEDYADGRLRLGAADQVPPKKTKLSPAEQLDFIVDRGGRRLGCAAAASVVPGVLIAVAAAYLLARG